MSGEASDPNYPIPSFYFAVSLSGSWTSGDNSFSEATGIGPEMQTETVVEGGENRFVHTLPGGFKHPKLVLKRGISRQSSELTQWCEDILAGGFAQTITPRLLYLRLMADPTTPLKSWTFTNAFPVKWSIDSFNAKTAAIAIETVEFSYWYSTRTG